MKAITLALLALVGFSGPANAQKASNDRIAAPVSPMGVANNLMVIYRIAGIRDDGSPSDQGVASTIMCTSFSNVTERMRFVVYRHDTTVAADLTYNVGARTTWTVSTHSTKMVAEDGILSTNYVSQGGSVILATSNNIHCTAAIVDAAAFTPQGIDLHVVRFNAVYGSME